MDKNREWSRRHAVGIVTGLALAMGFWIGLIGLLCFLSVLTHDMTP